MTVDPLILWPPTGALLGACLGSFAGVLVDRLPRGETIVTAPSRCRGCGVRLTPLDLVPIVSWLCLRGRCRRCGRAIGAGALLLEASGAAAGAAIALALAPGWAAALLFALLASVLSLVTLTLVRGPMAALAQVRMLTAIAAGALGVSMIAHFLLAATT